MPGQLNGAVFYGHLMLRGRHIDGTGGNFITISRFYYLPTKGAGKQIYRLAFVIRAQMLRRDDCKIITFFAEVSYQFG